MPPVPSPAAGHPSAILLRHVALAAAVGLICAGRPSPACADQGTLDAEVEVDLAGLGSEPLGTSLAAARPVAAEPTIASTLELDGRAPAPEGLARLLRDPRVLPIVEVAGLHALVMSWNRQVGQAPWAEVTPRSIGRNLQSAWVLDDNAYFVNQLGHPYQGTFSYTAARSAGLGFWTSTVFPFAASAAWELAGETERPALNDQITTTIGGVVLGEILFRLSDWVRGDGRSGWRLVPATLLSPMTSFNRGLGAGGARERPVAALVEVQVGGLLAPSAVPTAQGRVLAQPAPLLGVRVRNGVPGYADASFERPFDHFDLRFALAPADQTYLSLDARGLVVGQELGGAGALGAALWGLWLGFDLESPGARRVSTGTVGLGITGRQVVGDEVELDGTAIGSAVLLGAAGLVSKPEGSDRDYRMGPGTQSLLELGLEAGGRLRAAFEARHVLIFGAGGQGGHDQLLDGRASGQVRVLGRHAVRVEANRFLRLATEADGGKTRQSGTLVAVSWVYGAAAGGGGLASRAPRGAPLAAL